MSTVVSPVTVIAEVAVKIASAHGVAAPLEVEMGSHSRSEKAAAAATKTMTDARAGERRTKSLIPR